MITVITGKPGTGKSYTLTKIAKQHLIDGFDVFSNIKIDERNLKLKPKKLYFNRFINLTFKKNLPIIKPLGILYYWSRIEQFKDISQAIVIMDEAQTYFSSRRWQNMTTEDEIKFQQHRKQGIDIYAGVQNLNRCDKIIRELSAYVIELTRIGSLFIAKRFLPEEIDKAQRKALNFDFYFRNKTISEAYNTYELINFDSDDKQLKFTQMSFFFSD